MEICAHSAGFAVEFKGKSMGPHTVGILVVFVVYLLLMLVMGAFFFRKNEDMADYFLADRKLNKWVTSLSAQASDMSGWLLLGLPGAAYLAGLSTSWIALGLVAGTYLNWRFVAKRLRKYTALSPNILTISDYLEYRFRDPTRLLRVISALFILIFFLIYTSSGFVAGGKLFSSVFNFPYPLALAVGASVVISYTFLGGFNAVCWTDVIQGGLMFFAVLLVPLVGLLALGGPVTTVGLLKAQEPAFFSLLDRKDAASGLALFCAVASSLAWGLGYFGQPHILVRFMAIGNPAQLRDARFIAMIWVVLSLAGAVAVGMVGRAFMPTVEGGDSERIFIFMINDMFPWLIAGVFLSAILAAIMSTADSQLLVATSAITEDLYKAIVRKTAGQTELLWVSRSAVIAVAGLAWFVALNPASSVLKLVAHAWAGFGASLGPPIVLSLFWKRMTYQGALAGITAGGLTVLIWKHLTGGLFDLYELLPGFVFSAVAIVLGSLLSPPPSPPILAEFDRVCAELDEAAP